MGIVHLHCKTCTYVPGCKCPGCKCSGGICPLNNYEVLFIINHAEMLCTMTDRKGVTTRVQMHSEWKNIYIENYPE